MPESFQTMDDIKTATGSEAQTQEETERIRKFLKTAQERFKLAAEAEQKWRDAALDDLKFLAGDQWPNNLQTARENDGRPCLTINRLPQFKRQITNEQRQQRPSIQVNPVGSGADVDTAETLQGIIRHIEVNSDAEIAYDTGFDYMVTGGRGWWEVCTDYVDSKSFDQEIMIKRKRNPFTIYSDPAAIEPTRCDMDWAFEIEDLPMEEYKRDFPNSAAASMSDFSSIGDQVPEWATKDALRVAKYWHVEQTQVEICLLNNGSIVRSGEVPAGLTILRRRPSIERKVVCSLINAIEILEEQDWPGTWIPLVPVTGDEYEIDGKLYMAGMVRDSKDPQRMYNYWVSAGTEMIALAPRAPYVGAEGQFEGHEAEWQNSNVKNYAYLEYKGVDLGGKPAPPPQRQVYEPPVQAIALMTRQADNDMKAVAGIFDPTLGQNKSDQSGRAVQLLQKQSDISNLNFSDNLSRSIRWTGKVLLDLIPKIYDAPRIQRIINPDSTVSHVGVYNGQNLGGISPDQLPAALGVQKVFDIGTGRYDVTVSVGPSYQTKRQEAVAAQMALVQAYPQAMPILGDLIVRNMDWPQSQEMADRLKKQLPPQFQDDDQSDPQTRIQTLQSQVAQLSQQHELLTKALNDATQALNTKQVESQSRERIEQMKIEAQVTIAEINAKTQEVQTRIKMENELWKELHGAAHERAMQVTDQSHEKDLAETQAAQPQNGAQPNAAP